MEPAARQGPTALKLFAIFARIGLTSFGGGLSGWLLRTFVQDYRWLTEEEFLNGLAIAQAQAGPGGLVVVTGSLYVVAEAREALGLAAPSGEAVYDPWATR